MAVRAAAAIRLLALLVDTASAQTLPYAPTTILVPENTVPLQQNVGADIAYIFAPKDGSVELLTLNISSSVQASDLSLRTLSPSLPFLTGQNTAFAPNIAENGSLIVYAGNCSSSTQSSIWVLNLQADDAQADWTEQATIWGSDGVQAGPGFLGASLSFSTTLAPVMSTENVYVYGGMCPSTAANATRSQSEATYSNQMIKLWRSKSDSSTYSVQSVGSKSAPIPEAGFTFTGLVPSMSNQSGTVTQQINHVVLGGHTQSAFVNMSTAAIWSLPEESWAYVDIEVADSRTAGTELAIKSASQSVDARSGHSAVMNQDGDALIIYGGWVQNVSIAATPQLAILEMGAGYGGAGKWQWVIPENQPSGPGIYGHGAALLPGNVMMIYGGYDISLSGSSTKRQATSTNSNIFLNLTTMTWSDTYNNPAYLAAGGTPAESRSSSNDAKKRLGLGLGLGLGLAAVLATLLVYLFYRRRLQRKRAAREDAIRAIAQDTNRFLHHDMMERDDGHGSSWYTGANDPYRSGGRSLGFESLRGRGNIDGSNSNIPGNQQFAQIARKPIAPRGARGQYQPASTSDYEPRSGNRGGRAGPIHPIYEADEDGEMHDENKPASPAKEAVNRDSANYSDPFLTPTTDRQFVLPPPNRGSATPSPEGKQTTDPEVQDWMSDIDAADALISSRMATHSAQGGNVRSSPTRRGTIKSNRSGYVADDDSRTGSNVSESNRSTLSRSNSAQHRNSFGASAAVAAATAAAVAEERQGTSSSSSSAPSYNTARSSFPALRASGPALLMGNSPNNEDEDETPGSPSKMKPRRGWLGSLRRVFSGPTPSPTNSDREGSPIRDSMAESSDYDPRLGGLGGIAAGGLLRRKGGRHAWEIGEIGESSRRDGVPADEEDEWDIEKAVEKRLVQVLFTVPKERLRVVNAEPNPDRDLHEEIERLSAVIAKGDFDGEVHVVDRDGDFEKQMMLRGEKEHGEYARDKGKQRETVDSGFGTDIGSDRHMSPGPEDLLAVPAAIERYPSHGSSNRLGVDSRASQRHSSLTSEHSEGKVLHAEAVRLERPDKPKTRVLAMVESFEFKSRTPSPERPP
ncbi:uncharacterized protein BCR38DRAFT_457441 [Pseudomassariella vexata]|uniref:Galactose oxidase n=1 Tax=Pseudomassariella vexata TaxID=1141098 RepID=A0A1Y2E105_9PEZI|nr:uncharacterized protein BCR38DRAFT_457441 [Pseudomassariella vexata]ORY65233.1 hypothetical protein BCR38DRAFT_457441 [Pseudomassariella vexata]